MDEEKSGDQQAREKKGETQDEAVECEIKNLPIFP
jgi:hypothetical protein